MAGPGGVNLLHGGHLVAGAAPSFAAGNCSTTAAVNVRSGPDTGYPLAGKEPAEAQFTLQCPWQGGTSINGNATWDEVIVTDGVTGAITDDYTTTTSWNSYAPGTGACGSGSASPPPSSTGSLGGVDMQRACDTQYPGRGLRAVATNASSAYSWQCTGPGVSLGIDVTAECRTQYGYGAVSPASNPGSAWSCHCHWNITPQMQNAANWQSPRRTRLIPPGAIISGTTGADGASSSPSKPRASSSVILPPSRTIRRS